MMRECRKLLDALEPSPVDVLEISGTAYRTFGFERYETAHYPTFDICTMTTANKYDLIIAQQVFEHLRYPYRAARNVYAMLKAGGHFLIQTPFLVRVHQHPGDYCRWTADGLRYFLAECGFSFEKIQTGAWGNRACIKANFRRWVPYRPWMHSLRNEPAFPYHVWALATKTPEVGIDPIESSAR